MKLSTLIPILSWISVFAMAWLMILGGVKTNNVTWFFFLFFFVIAILSSLVSYGLSPDAKNKSSRE